MALKDIVIPQGTSGNFSFQIELDGDVFTLVFHFNRRADVWYFDLLTADGVAIRRSIKVTTAYPWLGQVKAATAPDGDLLALDTTQSGLRATFDTLNTRIQVLYEEGG